jgi:hypothetical protein
MDFTAPAIQTQPTPANAGTKQLERMRNGEDTTGMPKLVELMELPEDVARCFRKWLRLKPEVFHGKEGVTLEDFYAYMPGHEYIFIPTREMWPAVSVNARIGGVKVGVDDDGEPVTIPAALWLDQNKPVEQMTWAPGGFYTVRQ